MNVCSAGGLSLAALLISANADARNLPDTLEGIERDMSSTLDPSLGPALVSQRAQLVVQRCVEDVGPPDDPHLVAGLVPGHPRARAAARVLGLCAFAAYLALDDARGDGWRATAQSLDPEVGEGPGIPRDEVPLGMQIEGALAASRDPNPEPVTLDVDIDRPIPHLRRLPPAAPGSRDDVLIERINDRLRRRPRGKHRVDLPPGSYSMEVGDSSGAFLVPADPADRGPRTRVRLDRDEVGRVRLVADHGKSGYVPPPDEDWPPAPAPPPVDWLRMSRDVLLVSTAVAAVVGGGFLIAHEVGASRADDLTLSAADRRDGLELEGDASWGADVAFGTAVLTLTGAGVLTAIRWFSDKEDER